MDTQDEETRAAQEFWDARYRTAARMWSGEPNPRLVEHVAESPPGDALDVGSGEGADAIWLAARGWRVTGVDISPVALERAAARAARAGAEIADRITWRQADIRSWLPDPNRYDLVSAQFLHLPQPVLRTVHTRLAAAVRPGGTLLIVGHHPWDLGTSVPRPPDPGLFFTAEQVAATLDPGDWSVDVAEAAARQTTDPDGAPVTVHDAVLRAVRR
jgi:SAM-dependent methyltransferase